MSAVNVTKSIYKKGESLLIASLRNCVEEMDVELALCKAKGSKEMLKKVLTEAASELPIAYVNLSQSIYKENMCELVERARSLKNLLYNIGTPELASFAESMERNAEINNLHFCHNLLHNLEKRLDIFLIKLNVVLDANKNRTMDEAEHCESESVFKRKQNASGFNLFRWFDIMYKKK